MEKIKLTKEDCNEDSNVDVSKYKTTSRTELVENFTSAINGVRAAFYVLMNQNDEVGDRYNKVCAEANMLQTEVEKLKANNNNDLCIQLREEIACLKRDNGILKESNNTFVETIRDQEKQIRDLEEDVRRLKEILQAIKNLAL